MSAEDKEFDDWEQKLPGTIYGVDRSKPDPAIGTFQKWRVPFIYHRPTGDVWAGAPGDYHSAIAQDFNIPDPAYGAHPDYIKGFAMKDDKAMYGMYAPGDYGVFDSPMEPHHSEAVKSWLEENHPLTDHSWRDCQTDVQPRQSEEELWATSAVQSEDPRLWWTYRQEPVERVPWKELSPNFEWETEPPGQQPIPGNVPLEEVEGQGGFSGFHSNDRPVLYHPPTNTLYRGPTGYYHTDMMNSHPELRQDANNYLRDNSMWSGRQNDQGEIMWYHGRTPPEPQRSQFNALLGGEEPEEYGWDYDDPEHPSMWESERYAADSYPVKPQDPISYQHVDTGHDGVYGVHSDDHPFIYDQGNRQLYTGREGWYHSDLKDALMERGGEWLRSGFDGRVEAGGAIRWYHAPDDPEYGEVNDILRNQFKAQPQIYPAEVWSSIPTQPEVIETDGERRNPNYMWRRPIRYDPNTKYLDVGAPGDFHMDLKGYGHEGFVSIEDPNHRAQFPIYNLGLGWFSHPGEEAHQAVQEALKQRIPEAQHTYVPEDSDEDWDDDIQTPEGSLMRQAPGGYYLGSAPATAIPDEVWRKAMNLPSEQLDSFLRVELPKYIPEGKVSEEIDKAYQEWGVGPYKEDGYLPTYHPPTPHNNPDLPKVVQVEGQGQYGVHPGGAPVIYAPHDNRVYVGQPGWYHWDMINNNPDLMQQYDTDAHMPRNDAHIPGRMEDPYIPWDQNTVQWYRDPGAYGPKAEQALGAKGGKNMDFLPAFGDSAWDSDFPSSYQQSFASIMHDHPYLGHTGSLA